MTIDLTVWKLTLPTGKAGKPDEYTGSKLTGLADSPWFTRPPDGTLRFRAPVNGTTTKGSKNPRAELRELNPDGTLAGWSTTAGWHAMEWAEAITHLPNKRTDGGIAGVVGAQIHDGKDDVCVFRLEGTKLYVTKGDDTHYHLLDANYVLGTRYTGRFEVTGGVVRVFYNGELAASIPAKATGCYFKAGAYTQANSSNSKPADSTNYGETVLFGLDVTHAAKAPPSSPPPPAPGTRVVMILRHGEKPDDPNDHTLSARGRERASKLAWLFTRPDLTERGLYAPDRLFASKGATASMRMVQTLQPLQKALKLPMTTQFDLETAVPETGAWLRAQTGVTLACGEHSALVALGKTFTLSTGKLPASWPSGRFDVIWVFMSGDDGKSWHFYQVPEMLLLPGDKSTGL